jgi:DNA-binding NarL/FixJ family response regulator
VPEGGSAAARRRTGLVVVEDDAIVRDWVLAALEDSEFHVVGVAASGEEALDLIPRRRPDIALIDYRLNDCLGTELVRELRTRGVGVRAVIMTANVERGLNEVVREAGAQGSVLKSGRVDELLATLRRVRDQGMAFDTRHPRRREGQVALSPRERQVLALVARGATNREVALQLQIGEQTVKTLLARAFAKLGVHRRSEAVGAAYKAGLI